MQENRGISPVRQKGKSTINLKLYQNSFRTIFVLFFFVKTNENNKNTISFRFLPSCCWMQTCMQGPHSTSLMRCGLTAATYAISVSLPIKSVKLINRIQYLYHKQKGEKNILITNLKRKQV